MTAKLILMATAILGTLWAIWMFIIVPAEKRDHQRRLDLVQSKLEKQQAAKPQDMQSDDKKAAGDSQ
jgi:hypothetical protein